MFKSIITKTNEIVNAAISNTVVYTTVGKDASINKYNEVKVNIIAAIELAKEENVKRMEDEMIKYSLMYPELFVSINTDQELSKALLSAKVREVKEGKVKPVVVQDPNKESKLDMFKRIHASVV
jgi:hypothetical protein